MEVLDKAGKHVVYKSNIRLQFYGTFVNDCRINVDHIYVKLMSDGTCVVFGDYTYFLLYSYKNSSDQFMYTAESKNIKFSEPITCNLDKATNQEFLDLQASFKPQIFFKRAASNAYTWEIEVEGEFEISIFQKKNLSEEKISKNESNRNTNVKVMQLNNSGIPIKQLLEMDTDSISKMINSDADNNFSGLNEISPDQAASDDDNYSIST